MIIDEIIEGLINFENEEKSITGLIKIASIEKVSWEEAQIITNLLVPHWKSKNPRIKTLANEAFMGLKKWHRSLVMPKELLDSSIGIKKLQADFIDFKNKNNEKYLSTQKQNPITQRNPIPYRWIILCLIFVRGIFEFAWVSFFTSPQNASSSISTKSTPIDSRERYSQSAEQGNAEAQYELGLLYDLGYGVTQDYKEAMKWYRKAAEQGCASAQCKIGQMYILGNGIPKDITEADKWLRQSAEQGNADAQSWLGLLYTSGEYTKPDYKEALKWYSKAAEQGDKTAQLGLGLMFDRGDGVTQDYKEAVKWYSKAAEQGDKTAQFNLGLMFDRGDGVTQDYKEAVKWYSKAAEQGCVDAQYNLAVKYYKGEGVIQDSVLALMWSDVAHYDDAGKNQALFEKRMTQQQIEKARNMAKAKAADIENGSVSGKQPTLSLRNTSSSEQNSSIANPVTRQSVFAAICPKCQNPWELNRCNNCGNDDFYNNNGASIKCKKCDYICVNIGLGAKCLVCGTTIPFSKIQQK